jgi:hypothetical protein
MLAVYKSSEDKWKRDFTVVWERIHLEEEYFVSTISPMLLNFRISIFIHFLLLLLIYWCKVGVS